MKRDLENRADIEQLVNAFYDKVRADAVIGYIFNDIAKVNWEQHLPVMYDFWENIIFLRNTYLGNPMPVHADLSRRVPLTKDHFQRWIQLFSETADELFEGPRITLTKEKAAGIAAIMETKILSPFAAS
jgi:hemoglobin